ncbi:Toprim domain-containing protein [Nitrosospira sp. Nsp14]|uniref:PriCT-2 domain-containing protein n=1 Tax=Nitrosospira sp. Nsp14 TaxID=1855333 RepID=UPI0008EE80FA|nr:PriCT-2 domain-containing protein [Nitrosospira sp. Nsp14]SFH60653.1 Toprim domain-containing protein [Nitrosospira sp. Nsp14]
MNTITADARAVASDIEAALRFIPADDRNVWIRCGMAVKAELGEAGFDIWDEWSATSDKYRARETAAAWKSFKTAGEIGIGTLFYIAQQYGYRSKHYGTNERKRVLTVQQHETLSEYGQELFDQTKPIEGPASDYLHARKCVVPPQDSDLRYHPALKHPGGYIGPALVALVTDAITNRPITLHRTWIKSNGNKAEVEPPRLLLGGHRKAGGVIRLWPDTEVTLGLGVCEGIETSLSLAHAFTPVWSLVDAGNLASFPVLLGIEALSIGADNDAVGMKAARKCARGWTRAGKLVRIVIPQGQGDLNDVAMETE